MAKSATVASITAAMDRAFSMLKTLNLDTSSVKDAFACGNIDIAYFSDMLASENNLPSSLAEALTCYPERINQTQKNIVINYLRDKAVVRYLVDTSYTLPKESLLDHKTTITN